MESKKYKKEITPEDVDMSMLVRVFKTKSKIADFFKINRSSVTQWGEIDDNHVPKERKYEFLYRIDEVDNFVKN